MRRSPAHHRLDVALALRRRPRYRRALVIALAVFVPAAAVPAFAAALVANLILGIAGVSGFWAVLVVLGLGVGVGGPLFARLLRSPAALGGLLVAVLAAYLVAFGIEGSTVALSPFGPTQNSRYFGLSNLLETMLLVPALAGRRCSSRVSAGRPSPARRCWHS